MGNAPLGHFSLPGANFPVWFISPCVIHISQSAALFDTIAPWIFNWLSRMGSDCDENLKTPQNQEHVLAGWKMNFRHLSAWIKVCMWLLSHLCSFSLNWGWFRTISFYIYEKPDIFPDIFTCTFFDFYGVYVKMCSLNIQPWQACYQSLVPWQHLSVHVISDSTMSHLLIYTYN